jgi:UPF0176 protein
MRRVLAFYKFIELSDPPADQGLLLAEGQRLALKGTILVAIEGLNGTLVGSEAALSAMQDLLRERYGDMPFKWSDLDEANPGFYRYKVKLKPEIVSFGVEGLDVANNGEHVDIDRWNQLLADPDVVVVDTRNQYEIDIGTFAGAVSPNTTNFREFPAWVEQHLDASENKKIAMFCTGGIRCEKASAYMLERGFDKVYQLNGGILKYLEEVSSQDSQWQGECFVFDQRVSVTRELQQGQYQQCYACRHPLSPTSLDAPEYEEGVSCPHCIDDLDDERRAQFRERQRQVTLSEARGDQHIGNPQAQHGS